MIDQNTKAEQAEQRRKLGLTEEGERAELPSLDEAIAAGQAERLLEALDEAIAAGQAERQQSATDFYRRDFIRRAFIAQIQSQWNYTEGQTETADSLIDECWRDARKSWDRKPEDC